MKAVILERRGSWAAALREDGAVIKLKTPAQVGETVEVSDGPLSLPKQTDPKTAPRRVAKPSGTPHRWLRSAVAALLILVLAGAGAAYYTTAVAASFVSVDAGETSVELSVNRLGNVIAVTALNEGSADLAQSLSEEVRDAAVETAVERTLDRLQEKGVLDRGDDVIVGVTGENQRRGQELAQAVERGVKKSRESHKKDTKFYTVEGDRSDREKAREEGVSPGRFFAENEYRRAEESGQLSPKDTPPAWLEPGESAPASPATTPVPTPESETPVPTEIPAETATPAASETPVQTAPPTVSPTAARETSRPAASVRPTAAPPVQTAPPETGQPWSEPPAPMGEGPGESPAGEFDPAPGDQPFHGELPGETPPQGEVPPPEESGRPQEGETPPESASQPPAQTQDPGAGSPGGFQSAQSEPPAPTGTGAPPPIAPPGETDQSPAQPTGGGQEPSASDRDPDLPDLPPGVGGNGGPGG